MYPLRREIEHNLQLVAYRCYTTEIKMVSEWIRRLAEVENLS